MKLKRADEAISEIVGTVLLLGLTVAIFSTMYAVVVSSPSPPPLTFVNLVGTVEGNNIIIEHRGGEALSLDTKVIITIGNEIESITIGDSNYLDDEAKIDKKWNVGERLVYPFEYNLSCRKAEIKAMDKKSNSLIMIGTLDISPECDIGLKLTVDERYPELGDTVNITIRATNYRGDINAISIKINNVLPDGLVYQYNSTTKGNYNSDLGIWDINELAVGESVFLNITVLVTASGNTSFTQLAMILDGSGSISSEEWELMNESLASVIENPVYFPHEGSVELTVVQFGEDPGYARVEVEPTVVTASNYQDIADDIREISKLNGNTPMACGIICTADTLVSSVNFNIDHKQVIILVTDGVPNLCCYEGDWNEDHCHDGWYEEDDDTGKSTSEYARDYLLNTLQMTADQDEFNAIAVGDETDVNWLRDYIVWPGGYEWPKGNISPPGSGWVRYVSNYAEFADSIHELFQYIFSETTYKVKVEIESLIPRDVNIDNNWASIIIKPRES